MIRAHFCLFLVATVLLTGCGGSLRGQQPPARFSIGFWLWRGFGTRLPAPDDLTLDLLYFQAGEINQEPYMKRATVYAILPDNLPAAREYWMTLRFNHRAVPSAEVVPLLVQKVLTLRTLAEQRHMHLAGVRIDIDSPTGSLGQYAAFLSEIRKGLPAGFGLSVSAMLEWFLDGTQVSQVIQQVDEFVPEFYDLGRGGPSGSPGAVAAPLDASKWGPIFNHFGKRFRIGLSSLGRASGQTFFSYADLSPMDIASNPAFTLESSSNSEGELVLTYRANRRTRVGYDDFTTGQSIQLILPTAGNIHASVQAARGIGGNCAGVVFFRWAVSDEVLAMTPADVLAAAGTGPPARKPAPSVELIDGGCATTACADVYFLNAPSLSPAPFRYRLHASAELEYFLPEQRVPVRITGPSDLELSLPRYGGRPRIFLGRAVSKSPVTFTVQPEP